MQDVYLISEQQDKTIAKLRIVQVALGNLIRLVKTQDYAKLISSFKDVTDSSIHFDSRLQDELTQFFKAKKDEAIQDKENIRLQEEQKTQLPKLDYFKQSNSPSSNRDISNLYNSINSNFNIKENDAVDLRYKNKEAIKMMENFQRLSVDKSISLLESNDQFSQELLDISKQINLRIGGGGGLINKQQYDAFMETSSIEADNDGKQ